MYVDTNMHATAIYSEGCTSSQKLKEKQLLFALVSQLVLL